MAEPEVQTYLNRSRHSEKLWRLFSCSRPEPASTNAKRTMTMEWTYKISAAARPRVLMRIAQLFDQQLVPICVCLLEQHGTLLDIVITVEVEPELAQRIHAKLYHHVDLLSVVVVAGRLPVSVDR
jgi:hypothetical protein